MKNEHKPYPENVHYVLLLLLRDFIQGTAMGSGRFSLSHWVLLGTDVPTVQKVFLMKKKKSEHSSESGMGVTWWQSLFRGFYRGYGDCGLLPKLVSHLATKFFRGVVIHKRINAAV